MLYPLSYRGRAASLLRTANRTIPVWAVVVRRPVADCDRRRMRSAIDTGPSTELVRRERERTEIVGPPVEREPGLAEEVVEEGRR